MPHPPPLVLTGPPAVGKSVTGRALAQRRPRGAFIDVDDVRQLVVAGGAAPWDGAEGLAQQRLGARNACCLAANFLGQQVDVVIADVLTPDTARIYLEQLPGCRIVHLRASRPEALRRAASRRIWLTDDEFRLLHEADAASPPPAHDTLVVDGLTVSEQVRVVERFWHSSTDLRPG